MGVAATEAVSCRTFVGQEPPSPRRPAAGVTVESQASVAGAERPRGVSAGGGRSEQAWPPCWGARRGCHVASGTWIRHGSLRAHCRPSLCPHLRDGFRDEMLLVSLLQVR